MRPPAAFRVNAVPRTPVARVDAPVAHRHRNRS